MLKRFIQILVLLCLFSSSSHAASKLAVQLDINSAISPAVQDYIQRGLEYARYHNAELVIIKLDTPGGLETSMHNINRAILASPIPVVTYVAPAGARAASAGTFIMYASQIAAMAPGTNVGAASPVNINGMSAEKSDATMNKKVMNDASAYIRSLAQLRGRNINWAENAVRQAVSISAEEALKLKVINVVADNIPQLLQKINNTQVSVLGKEVKLQTADIVIQKIKPDWRFEFLSIITDPSVAYILLLIGIYGMFFEFYSPGMILPGAAGAICLILALYAFQLLPINYAGFALLALGIAFMISEAFITSFGILGIGGVIAFILGSIFLLDSHTPGFAIAWQLILIMSLITVSFFLVIVNLTIRSMRKKVVTGREALIGSLGEILEYSNHTGQARVHGEIWRVQSRHHLQLGQKIRVTDISGLQLTVEPISDNNHK